MSTRAHSSGILVDKTCPTFPATTVTHYYQGVFQPSNPLTRCVCPCLNCTFYPTNLGNLCTRLAPAQEAFVREGQLSDYHIDRSTGSLTLILRSDSPLPPPPCNVFIVLLTAGNWTDLVYTADSSTVTVYWSGFADAESGIGEYRVAVGRGVYNPVLGFVEVQPEYFMPFTPTDSLDTQWTKSSFSFPDGSIVVTSIMAINNASLGTVASSDGFTIDL